MLVLFLPLIQALAVTDIPLGNRDCNPQSMCCQSTFAAEFQAANPGCNIAPEETESFWFLNADIYDCEEWKVEVGSSLANCPANITLPKVWSQRHDCEVCFG
jgi:hypothetical protein